MSDYNYLQIPTLCDVSSPNKFAKKSTTKTNICCKKVVNFLHHTLTSKHNLPPR